MKNLHYVDTMRGVAILMVILVHTAISVNDLSYPVRLLADYGQMGVQLFFVASAYTLCVTFIRRQGEPKPIISFFIRRFFRIAPLYYIAIFLYFAVHLLIQLRLGNSPLTIYPYSAFNIVSNALFIHGFIPSANNTIVPGGWSIGTEMAFYVCFPILFTIFARLNTLSPKLLLWASIVMLMLNVIGQMIIAYSFKYSIGNNNFLYFNLFNQLPVFLLGMTAFFFHKDDDVARFTISVPLQGAGFILCSVLALTLRNLETNWVFAFTPTISGVSFLFLLNLLRALSNHSKALCAIGRASYSMYVFHFIFAFYIVPAVIKIIDPGLSSDLILLTRFVLVCGLTFAMAMVTERLVEARGIALGRAIINRLHTRYRPVASGIN